MKISFDQSHIWSKLLVGNLNKGVIIWTVTGLFSGKGRFSFLLNESDAQTGLSDDTGSLQWHCHPWSKATVKHCKFWKWLQCSQNLVKSHWLGRRTRGSLTQWVSETSNGSDNTNKQISETRPGSRKDWCSGDVRDLSNSFRKAESISSMGIDVTGKQQARFHTQILSLRRSDLWKSPGSGCLCDSSRAGINPGEDSFSSSQKMGSCLKWACRDRGPSTALGTNPKRPWITPVSPQLFCLL